MPIELELGRAGDGRRVSLRETKFDGRVTKQVSRLDVGCAGALHLIMRSIESRGIVAVACEQLYPEITARKATRRRICRRGNECEAHGQKSTAGK